MSNLQKQLESIYKQFETSEEAFITAESIKDIPGLMPVTAFFGLSVEFIEDKDLYRITK